MGIFGKPRLSDVKRLLAESGLPTADLTARHLAHFWGCGSKDRLDGVVGLEIYGTVALLRSLAVAEKRRGAGLGTRLVAHAEAHARRQGVAALYLLTGTAEEFFRRRGYTRAAREEAPAVIQGTAEFSSICPKSAAFMVKDLGSA